MISTRESDPATKLIELKRSIEIELKAVELPVKSSSTLIGPKVVQQVC
jgi:hypothetical protein